MWRSRWRCVIKPAYSVSFLLSINIVVWQNVLYFLDAPHIHLTLWIRVHSFSSWSILILFFRLLLGLLSGLVPWIWLTSTLPLIRSTHASPNSFSYLITLKIYVEKYKSWSSKLCNFRHCPLAANLVSWNVLLSLSVFMKLFSKFERLIHVGLFVFSLE